MRLAALCSGGKDSSYALWLAMKEGHSISYLVVMSPERDDSWMFHRPNVHLANLLSECTNLPLIEGKTKGDKEREPEDLKRTLKGADVDGVVSGVIASNYQKNRIDSICADLDLISIAPLWKCGPLKILGGMLADNFDVIITGVSAEGLNENWLGRKIDEECVRELEGLHERFGINPSGEGGEFETFVLDAPYFQRRIEPVETEILWYGNRGILLIKMARGINKK